jgi:hypothetical protein
MLGAGVKSHDSWSDDDGDRLRNNSQRRRISGLANPSLSLHRQIVSLTQIFASRRSLKKFFTTPIWRFSSQGNRAK